MDNNVEIKDNSWETLTYTQKNHVLFLKQKQTLSTLLEHGAISKAQYDKSLSDLIEKMGKADN